MQTKSNWHKKLLQIPRIQKEGMRAWQPIYSGSSNQVCKVTTNAGIWVVRINHATLGINRLEEQRIMTMVEPLGIGPHVIENNLTEGYLITEYIAQPYWKATDFNSQKNLRALQERMNVYHSLPYDYLPSRLDYRIRHYLKTLKNIPARTSIALLDDIQKLEFLGFWKTNNTLYHSDLNPNNILGFGKTMAFVDWEFAGQGHPLLDWLILEYETKIDLSAYYPQDINPVWLAPAQRMIYALMNIWPQRGP